jgi:hypothetical protein
MGDAEGAALVAVGQVEAEMFAIGEKLNHVTDALAADDNHDLPNAHTGQGGDREVDHRPVVYRQEVLVGDDGEWEEAGSCASRQD